MKKVILLLLFGSLLLSGCGQKQKAEAPKEPEPPQVVETPKEPEQNAPEPEEDLTGKAKNPLTGLYIAEEEAKKRPVAVTINNLHKALPQSGIGEADIIYEVLAEGEITRLVAIFQSLQAEKIGPVRSAREYFTYFALDNDAIYVHHGGSPNGYTAIKKRGVAHIDGMNDGAFWRDKTRANQPGMYEHSSYTSAAGITKSSKEKGFRIEEDEGYEGMFRFQEEDTNLKGEPCSVVTLPYSTYQVSEFRYDSNKGMYDRNQSGDPQIDETTGEILSAKNIIIQFANTYVLAGDDAGRRGIDLVGNGDGYYISNAAYIPITWEKGSYNSPTKWYDEKGLELRLNPGKTWICVYPKGQEMILSE